MFSAPHSEDPGTDRAVAYSAVRHHVDTPFRILVVDLGALQTDVLGAEFHRKALPRRLVVVGLCQSSNTFTRCIFHL